MKHGFYFKIASQNIRNNMRLYFPRILTEAGLLGCFYIMITLSLDQRLSKTLGGAYLSAFMGFGAVVIGLLSLILILYVNSFLMKRRRSDYGLYNVLGLEKRHIIRVLFTESLITSLVSVLAGLLFGMLFYKASSLLICRLFHADAVAGFYYLSAPTLAIAAVIFIGMDFFAFAVNSVSIMRLKPVEMVCSDCRRTEPWRWLRDSADGSEPSQRFAAVLCCGDSGHHRYILPVCYRNDLYSEVPQKEQAFLL